MGFALQVFAAVRQVATASSMWCIAGDNAYNHIYFMCPNNQRWYILLLGGYANQKSKHAVLALGNRVYMGALENTHPQTNGLGKYVLFPVLRYIYGCQHRYT
jgi:hypothetical protein